MTRQISIDELLRPVVKIEIPLPMSDEEKIYTIPQDVWETRCIHCEHKNASENRPIPSWAVWKHQYSEIIPCRIMTLSHPGREMTGECMSFAPKLKTPGICYSCEHSNCFHEGFCMKEDHAPQRRVFYGTNYGGDEKNKDYWSRHVLSICDDYKPNHFVEVSET